MCNRLLQIDNLNYIQYVLSGAFLRQFYPDIIKGWSRFFNSFLNMIKFKILRYQEKNENRICKQRMYLLSLFSCKLYYMVFRNRYYVVLYPTTQLSFCPPLMWNNNLTHCNILCVKEIRKTCRVNTETHKNGIVMQTIAQLMRRNRSSLSTAVSECNVIYPWPISVNVIVSR